MLNIDASCGARLEDGGRCAPPAPAPNNKICVRKCLRIYFLTGICLNRPCLPISATAQLSDATRWHRRASLSQNNHKATITTITTIRGRLTEPVHAN
eukprot:9167263-Pyramimonas_sp.AAC.1